MSYQLTKELQKFIFSILVLGILVVGVIILLSSQFEIDVDTTDVELYNAYKIFKDCEDCKQENVCFKSDKDLCKGRENCKIFGYSDKVEVCM